MQYEIEMQTAKAALRQAAKLTAHVQHALRCRDVLEKEDRSPVTKADFGAQAIVNRILSENFPTDPVIAEERAAALREEANRPLLQGILEALAAAGQPMAEQALFAAIDHGIPKEERPPRFWTLDPIDGTKGFLRGDHYAIALALVEDGEVRMGALACPNMQAPNGEKGLLCLASRNRETVFTPLFSDGESMSALTGGPLAFSEARVCESVESGHTSHGRSARIAEILGIAQEPFRIDSQCKYAAVALGLANIYLRLPSLKGYEEKIWDHAAGKLVVEMAGGTVTDTEGRPLDFGRGATLSGNRGVVASSGIDHEKLIEAVRATAEE